MIIAKKFGHLFAQGRMETEVLYDCPFSSK